MAQLGKDFEKELLASCKQLKAWSHNSNNGTPACDRLACFPVELPGGGIVGLSLLLEAKECRSERFEFSRVSDQERKHLTAHSNAGGISLLILKLVSAKPRCFAAHWEDWEEIEAGHGYEHGQTSARRAAGTASISLAEGMRPPTLIEVHKVDRPSSLGKCWDLGPLCAQAVELLGVRNV